MKKYFLFISLLWGLVAAASIGAETIPELSAKPDPFARAHKFELRGESYSAQMEYQADFERLLAEIAQNKEPEFNAALAEFVLDKLLELSKATGENREVAEIVGRALQGGVKGFLRRRLLGAGVELNMRLGQVDRVEEYAAQMGGVQRWFLYRTPGSAGEILYREIVSPDRVLSPDVFFNAKKSAKLTAAFVVDNKSAQAQRVALRVDTTEPVAMYVNNREVFADSNERDELSEVKVVSLLLAPGRNVVRLDFQDELNQQARLRVCLEPGEGGESLEVLGQDGADIVKKFTDSAATLEGGYDPKVETVDPGATRIFAAAIKQNLDNSAYAYYLGYILASRQTLGKNSTAPTQLLMQAAKTARDSGVYFLELAKAGDQSKRAKADRDENMRRLALLKVVSIDPQSVGALTELAKYYLYSVGSLEQASEYIKQALKNNPQSVEANLAQVDLYRRRGWLARAYGLLGELAKRNPQVGRVRLYEAELAERFYQAKKAEDGFRAAYMSDRTDLGTLTRYLNNLYTGAKFEQWRKVLDEHAKLYPYDTDPLADLVRYHLFRGDLAAAGAALGRLEKINPNSAQYLKLAGELAQAKGEPSEKFYEKALAADTSDLSLRDYLAFKGQGQDSPMTEIASVADYAQKFDYYKPAAGTELVYLLDEQVEQLHEDSTKSRSRYTVIKIIDSQGAQKSRRVPIWYDQEHEQVKVQLSKVVHSDGSSSTAQVVPISRRGDKQVVLVVFPSLVSGDIVELKYTVSQKKPDFFGDYFGDIHIFRRFNPVLRGRYVLISPKGKELYFHQYNGAPKPVVAEEGDKVVRSWQMNDLPALDYEMYMPRLTELSPVVQVSTFKDWDALARWYWNLIKDQNRINPDIAQKVQELTANISDPKKKLEAIYKWVIDNVRNNAWEFGVHGYKPYNAEAIFTRRFGDCKDKATLINVMAKEAGIEAWPLLLRSVDPAEAASGRTSEDLTLPLLSHFNHCISVADIGGQKYYLDGTMQFQTLDSLPFTDTGAEAVIVRPEGAERVSLPKHIPQTNTWQGLTQMRINDKGDADFEFTMSGTGQISVFLRSWFRNPQSWDNVLRAVARQKLGRVTAVVVDDVVLDGLANAGASLQGRVRVKRYARNENDQRLFRIPGPLLEGRFGGDGAVPKKLMSFAGSSLRSSELVLPSLFDINRQVRVEWPEGWGLAEKFENINYKSDFAELKVEYVVTDNMLEVNYRMMLKKMVISLKDYPAFRRFCQMVDRINSHSYILQER